MDFKASKTIVNLGRAFAGESQARNRYLFYAEQAKKEGYEALNKIILGIAYNEYAHAQEFFKHVKNHCGAPLPNLNIDAGYPYEWETTNQNLQFAANAENAEATEIYPSFADVAKSEGYTDIERTFRLIAEVEAQHNKIFTELYDKFNGDKVYQSQTPVEWECSFCGYRHTGTQAWGVCPICGKPQGWVKIPLSSSK